MDLGKSVCPRFYLGEAWAQPLLLRRKSNLLNPHSQHLNLHLRSEMIENDFNESLSRS